MNDCHSQAVRGSRARAASDCRRISPGYGERALPTLEPLPGKATPFRSVCVQEQTGSGPVGLDIVQACVPRRRTAHRSPRGWSRRAHQRWPVYRGVSGRRREANSAGLTSSMWSCAATLWDARRSTTSAGLKPASPMRARIVSVGSDGSGTSKSGEGCEMFERPARNCRRGPPAQLETPTAPANWILFAGYYKA